MGWDVRAQVLGEGALEKSTVPGREGSAVKGHTDWPPPEGHWETWQEVAVLSLSLPRRCPKHLREDRAGLHTTTELLQVRVQSLTHILCMQEEELARRVGPWPRPLTPGCPLCMGGVGVPLLEPARVFLPLNASSCSGS